MNAPFENIVQHLFHQPSLHSVTLDELQRMASRHPTFAAAQFLLLKKMQETEDPLFGKQLQKTALYFQNPLWLQYLLQPPAASMKRAVEHIEEPIEEHVDEPIEERVEEHIEEPPPLPNEEAIYQPELEEAEGEPIEAVDIPEVVEETVAEPPLEVAEGREPEYDKEPGHAATIEYETPQAVESERAWEHKETPADENQQPKADAEVPWKIVEQSPKTDLLFEPFHTVDYFASQGIKTDKQEENPQDRLGKQLKSFTGWLKSMKKLPQASVERLLGENEESAVVTAAAHSLDEKEVITEAMAEVYRKQGLKEKSAEVYRKLSLLNPSKSHYFATRIEELNNS